MSTRTFPKSYLLERIDARIASLDRQDAVDAPAVALNRAAADSGALGWLRGLPDVLNSIARDAKKRLATLDSFTPGDHGSQIREAAKAIETRLGQVERDPYPRPGWGTQAASDREAANNAERRIGERRRERDALTHTRAYLTDTPIEEFSTTMLGRLGLLDAVKFNLDEARAEAAATKKKARR